MVFDPTTAEVEILSQIMRVSWTGNIGLSSAHVNILVALFTHNITELILLNCMRLVPWCVDIFN